MRDWLNLEIVERQEREWNSGRIKKENKKEDLERKEGKGWIKRKSAIGNLNILINQKFILPVNFLQVKKERKKKGII